MFDSLPYRGCENKLMVFGVCSLTAREYFVRTDDPGLNSLLVRREYRTSNLSHISPSASEHNWYGLRLKHELAQAHTVLHLYRVPASPEAPVGFWWCLASGYFVCASGYCGFDYLQCVQGQAGYFLHGIMYVIFWNKIFTGLFALLFL